MASTSASRPDGASGRLKTSAATISSENETLIEDIHRALAMMKDVAIDLEKENQFDMVKQLEDGLIELLQAADDCGNLSTAVGSVANNYNPDKKLTNFGKLLDKEIAKLKAKTSSAPQNHPSLRKFKEAVWNVHHAGQPMPGEEQEDIVMTSTQCSLLNITCPITGKPIIELKNPVRSVECKHIYDEEAIMHHIRTMKSNARCPIAGCPRILVAAKVVCDRMLRIEIDELRSTSKQSSRVNVIEDFTGVEGDADADA